jgi:transcriptional regulator with XRE-family HTH domain
MNFYLIIVETLIKSAPFTIKELEASLGRQIRALRIKNETDQKTLAEHASVSLSALRNLEMGRGVSLKTAIAVLRALGRADFLNLLAPAPTVSPMQMLKATKSPRQRAYSPRKQVTRV